MSQSSSSLIKVGIVGGTGYTGVELLRLLSQHPHVEIQAITSRKEHGLPVASLYPSLRGRVDLCFTTPDQTDLTACDVVFFATPHGVAMNQARQLVEAGVKVIDLAADFRLQNLDDFKKWYKLDHACPDLLKEAVYGLPEIHRERIRKARIIGNPGCYPTTMQLGLWPLLASPNPSIDVTHIIADCKSGISGAGRKEELAYLFSETSDSFKAYAVAGHRHHPETVARLNELAGGRSVGLTFVPHLVPMIRGMHSTIYARITPEALGMDFQSLFEEHYKNEAFVDVMPAGSTPETRSVKASNQLRIAIHRPNNGDLLVILVVQDNLVKGASGQAVQCMNLMFDLPEASGLQHVAVLP